MVIISKKILKDFSLLHKDCEEALEKLVSHNKGGQLKKLS
jgi:hypothetical protein